jgi:hypothetical protein
MVAHLKNKGAWECLVRESTRTLRQGAQVGRFEIGVEEAIIDLQGRGNIGVVVVLIRAALPKNARRSSYFTTTLTFSRTISGRECGPADVVKHRLHLTCQLLETT